MQHYLRKYGVETVVNFYLYEIDGVDFRTDAADGGTDCTIRKDQGADATATNDFADEGIGYSLTIAAGEMEAAEITVAIVDTDGTKVYLDEVLKIETYGNASAQHAFDLDTALASQTVGTCTTNTDMRGTDSAALASVVGALDDAAAAGDPTDADTIMKYIKQLLNVLVGSTGIGTWPAEQAPGDGINLFEAVRAMAADVTGLNGDAMRGTDSAYTGTPPTAEAIINEFETQSLADPTGFRVNVMEVNGTAQTANDNGADINEILTDTGSTLDTLIKDIPTVAEFEARSLVAADYTVVSDLGTVQSGDAYGIVNHADYGNAKLVRSTTPANTLDVSGTGEAGLDFDNIKDATGAHTLTNITVPTVTTNSDMRGTDGANTVVPDAAGTAAVPGDAMTLEAGAIKATTYDESTAFPLTSSDAGATAVARTGADSDTLETLSDEIAAAQTDLDTLTDARGEPAQGAPPLEASTNLKIDHMYKRMRNKQDSDGTTEQYYNDDTTTVDSKRTVSAAGGTVTKAEIVTGP